MNETFFPSICAPLLMMFALSAHSTKPTDTIPVITINTQDGIDIIDKETTIPAVMSISVPDGYMTPNGNEAENSDSIEPESNNAE